MRFHPGLPAPIRSCALATFLLIGLPWTKPGASAQTLTAAGLVWSVHTDPSSAVSTIGAGLRHADPSVRTVAARLVAVPRAAALSGVVAEALASEQDDVAAAEMMRTLLIIASPESLAAAEARLPTAHLGVVRAYVAWLARMYPARLRQELPALVGRFRDRHDANFEGLVSLAASQHPSHRAALLQIWLDLGHPEWWRGLLVTYPFATIDAAEMVTLRKALDSTNAGIRQETVWQVLTWAVEGKPVPVELLDAASDLPGTVGSEVTWERVGRELLARHHKKAATPDRADAMKRDAAQHRTDARILGGHTSLTRPERDALRSVLGDLNQPAGPQVRPDTIGSQRRMSPMRTVPAITPGFFTDLLKSANCEVGGEMAMGVLQATYHSDGRPEHLALDIGGLPQGCIGALGALARVVLLDQDELFEADSRQMVLLPGQRDWIACIDQPAAAPPARLGPDTTGMLVPRKLRNVAPIYPPRLASEGIGGLVIVEGVITRKGCVGQASIERTVTTALDLAAMTAMLQWRYTPPTLNGVPVDVILTAAINFSY